MSRDDDDRPRERLSWREIDKRRGGARTRPEDRPKSRDEIARDSAAAKAYTKKLDALFVTGKGGAAGERLAREMREARGTPGLAAACRAYRDAVGLPDDLAQLSLFLDSGDPELVLAALGALAAARAGGTLQPTSGLRTQLRLLAQDADDAVAEAAEELLASL
ncbi:MAG TPA: hypothetical protein VII72_15560 [Myxococcota bacterium]